MPKIKTLRTKRPPLGWEIVEPTLQEFEQRMRDIETEHTESRRKVEAMWPIMTLNSQRSRYIYELFYRKHEISRELYEYLLREQHADAALIAKWKKPGFERLCCLLCVQKSSQNFKTTCICRVPKDRLDEARMFECRHCGCRGCASGD
jgi:bud site selection protein 31